MSPPGPQAPAERSSRIPGLYKLSVEERLRHVAAFAGLTPAESSILRGWDLERLAQADRMIENVVGLFHLPVGFAANFRVDDVDRLIPMVIEEPSVVAAASHAAKLLRGRDGIRTEATAPLMIGQIQLCAVPDLAAGRAALEAAEDELVSIANDQNPRLVARGGGARGLVVRPFEQTAIGPMLVMHLHVDVCDAMGANLVNGMVEALAPEAERLTGGQAFLRILSNLADQRLVSATGRVPLELLDRPELGYTGRQVADRVQAASVFAEVDPYRAATHNKGIMNGVDAFLLATGQDWRAVEAGVHAYGARDGRYTALATWRAEEDALVGKITLPMQVGTVGGVVTVHPVVKVLLKVLGVEGASAVGRHAAAVGLAQNLAAILALATEGIQRGHMSLHARNIAAAAGASHHQLDGIVEEMIRRRTISAAGAEAILAERNGTAGVQAAGASVAGHPPPITMEEIRRVRDELWPDIERLVLDVAPPDRGEGSLGEMVRYLLGTGGKRLRAVIPLFCYRAFGQEAREAVPFAAAVELLHNSMLVHDDAEARVRTRRGADTLWVRYGADQAINLGDGLVWVALGCLERLGHPAEARQKLTALIYRLMSDLSAAQVAAHGRERHLEDWLQITRDRTGGLFAMAISGAAILGGAPDEVCRRLEAIGDHLGVIFQVQDELLDLIGGKPGAPRGGDLADGRTGLLVAHCQQVAPPEHADELRAILAKARKQTTPSDVGRAVELLGTHGTLTWASELLRAEQAAVDELAIDIEHPEIKRLLRGISDIFLAPLFERL